MMAYINYSRYLLNPGVCSTVFAKIAQLVEHLNFNQGVDGSIPSLCIMTNAELTQYLKSVEQFVSNLKWIDGPTIKPQLPLQVNYPWYYVQFEIEGGVSLFLLKRFEEEVIQFLRQVGGTLEDITLHRKSDSSLYGPIIARLRVIAPFKENSGT